MVKEENGVRTLRGQSAEVDELAKKLSNRALTTSRGLQLCWSLLAEEICYLKGRLDTEEERRNVMLNEVKKVTAEVGELKAMLALFEDHHAEDETLDRQHHWAEPTEGINNTSTPSEESGKQIEGDVSYAYVDIADIMESAPMNLSEEVYRRTLPSAYAGNKITITNNHTGVTITGNHAGVQNGGMSSPKFSPEKVPEAIDNVLSTVPWLSKETPSSSSRKSSPSGSSHSKRREKYIAKIVRKSPPLPDHPKQESVPPKILASTKMLNKNHDLLDQTLFGAKDRGDGRRWWEGCLLTCHYCPKQFHDTEEMGTHVRRAHRLMARDNMMVNNYSVEEMNYFNCKLCFLAPKLLSRRVGYGLKCQKSSILNHLKENHSLTSISEYESLCTGYAFERNSGC